MSRTETLAYITVASKGIHSWSLTFRLDPYLVHTHRQMNPMLWQDNLSPLPFKSTEKILQSEHSKETFLEELQHMVLFLSYDFTKQNLEFL